MASPLLLVGAHVLFSDGQAGHSNTISRMNLTALAVSVYPPVSLPPLARRCMTPENKTPAKRKGPVYNPATEDMDQLPSNGGRKRKADRAADTEDPKRPSAGYKHPSDNESYDVTAAHPRHSSYTAERQRQRYPSQSLHPPQPVHRPASEMHQPRRPRSPNSNAPDVSSHRPRSSRSASMPQRTMLQSAFSRHVHVSNRLICARCLAYCT